MVSEMIGSNLGYEQLPLHLHISAYELNELGIDPYYFTVQIAVYNAGSGRTRQAVQAVLNALPEDPDARARFYQRVQMWFALNDIGSGATDIAKSLDLDAAMVGIVRCRWCAKELALALLGSILWILDAFVVKSGIGILFYCSIVSQLARRVISSDLSVTELISREHARDLLNRASTWLGMLIHLDDAFETFAWHSSSGGPWNSRTLKKTEVNC